MTAVTDRVIAGPAAWFDRARLVAGADVAGKFARDPHNGRAGHVSAAMEVAREADARKRRIENAVLEAVKAMAVDKELHADFAARLDGLAGQISLAMHEARGLGWLKHAARLHDLQSILETMAGEVRADIAP